MEVLAICTSTGKGVLATPSRRPAWAQDTLDWEQAGEDRTPCQLASMNRRTCMILLVCGLFAAIVSFYGMHSIDQTAGGRTTDVLKEVINESELELDEHEEGSHLNRFLYLIQTESCLPDNLESVEVFGNALSCQCDVLVLSFKQACRNTVSPHIEYIYNSSTTWGKGRNLLYEVAMKRSEKYLYYIFMDDDIVLKKSTKKNPWREFEDFLKRIEPAVAAVDIDTHPCLPVVYAARKNQGCVLKEPAEYLPAVRFDAAFNAFHYRAVEYILPYSSRFDATTWWYNQLYVAVKCEIIFRGQAVLHNTLHAINQLHRPYPRKDTIASNVLAAINEIEAKLPKEYRNTTLLLEWKRDRLKHERISSTLCLPPPLPHMPIKPYAHFGNKARAST